MTDALESGGVVVAFDSEYDEHYAITGFDPTGDNEGTVFIRNVEDWALKDEYYESSLESFCQRFSSVYYASRISGIDP